MAYDVDHRPGAWVRARTTRRERIFWACLAVGFAATGVYFALALDHRISLPVAFGFLAAVATLRPYGHRYLDRSARLLRGTQAEESVGETLDELRREGWVLMHDVEQEYEGNIDHIAWSAEHGVFLIETKARGYEDDQLTKAKRQAAKLKRELGVYIPPVICLYERRGKPFRHKGVDIVPVQHLLGWLRKQHYRSVPFERLALYADRVN